MREINLADRETVDPAPSERPLPIASLPWYDLREIRPSTDGFWDRLARHAGREGLRGVPDALDRSTGLHRQWASPDLLLSQACGYNALLSHAERLRVVATPRYSAPGCEGPRYRSFLLVRQDASWDSLADLRGARCAVNTRISHSGMNVLRALVAPFSTRGRFFGDVLISGSHERSIGLIRKGAADVVSVDCVTYALLKRDRPRALEGTRILMQSPLCPAPPFVTSRSTPPAAVERLRRALVRTVEDPRLADARRALFLEGIDVLPLVEYRPIAQMAATARDWGYDELPGPRRRVFAALS